MTSIQPPPPPCPISSLNFETGYIIEDKSRESLGIIKKYKIGKILGKGGFAKCYEMISLDSGRIYAGKIVPKLSLQKSSAKRKLLNEIKIHKSLEHPNIVKFERFFEDINNVYILLEVCKSQTMMELLKSRKRLTECEVRYFMLQLIQTIRYLHQKNVIHRDLKLGNLFLGDSMNIKIGYGHISNLYINSISDFGLAAKLDFEGDRKKTVCGTPNYIAPEILDGKFGHSFEVDTWSLGVIMYTLLIGKPPFETANVKSTYKRIRANQYSFPAFISISPEAVNLIESILQLEPEKRPSLDAIQSHPFMCGDTPMYIPLSALQTQPAFKKAELFNPFHPLSSTNRLAVIKEEDAHFVRPEPKLWDRSERNSNKENNGAIANSIQTFNENTLKPTSQKASSPTRLFNVIKPNQNINSTKENNPFHSTQTLSTSRNVFNTLYPANVNNDNNLNNPKKIPAPTFESTYTSKSVTIQSTRREDAHSPTDMFAVMNLNGNPQLDPPTATDARIEADIVDDTASDDEENGSLRQLHQDLESGLSQQGNNVASFEEFASAPLNLWVAKWVDYTEKYGLGYLLSNGSIGVFFNDSSRIILNHDSVNFEYFERKTGKSNAELLSKYTLDKYPTELQKKVTLLKHFKKYLLQDNTTPLNPSKENGEMVHIKRWLRTKHAILFRLSNRTVQINFLDHTELILSSAQNIATFTDKSGVRNIYPLSSLIDKCPSPEVHRRMKYAKDILHYMINSNHK